MRDKRTQTEKPLKIRPNTERALKSNKKCKRYMGINLHLFKQFMLGLKGKFYNSYKMGPEDQLCLFFNKLKVSKFQIQIFLFSFAPKPNEIASSFLSQRSKIKASVLLNGNLLY